jgi:Na+-transporting NADH:ubiquinone oxidoreductase subunit NqrB
MKPSITLLTVVGLLTLAQPQAFAEPRWTFCVASAEGTRDVWLTDVFAAPAARSLDLDGFHGTAPRQRAQVAGQPKLVHAVTVRTKIWSTLVAMMKSFSCSPLIFLVCRETVALPQPKLISG